MKPPGDPSDTPDRHETGCRGGSDDECHALGLALDRTRGDISSGFPAFKAGCDAKSMEACRLLGKAYQFGKAPAPKDDARGAALFTKACDGGNADACGNLAWSYDLGQGVQKDEDKAFSLMEKSCNGHAQRFCFALGDWYGKGNHGRKDTAKAFDIYTKSCDAGQGDSCSNLAEMYRRGTGVPVDRARADALSKKGCMSGSGVGCIQLEEGSPACAEVLLQKACDLSHTQGCAKLAYLYSDARLVPKDPAKAAQFFRRSCEAGETAEPCCFNAGLAYGRGEGVPKDVVVSADLFRRGCDAGHAGACFNLGIAFENGTGVTLDWNRALALYQQACAGKHQTSPQACTEAERLQKTKAVVDAEIQSGRCSPDRAARAQAGGLGLKRTFDAMSTASETLRTEDTKIIVATDSGTSVPVTAGLGGEYHLFVVGADPVRLSVKDGSGYDVSTPSEYQTIIQNSGPTDSRVLQASSGQSIPVKVFGHGCAVLIVVRKF